MPLSCSKCSNPKPSAKKPTRCFCGGALTEVAESDVSVTTKADRVREEIQQKRDEKREKPVHFGTNFNAHIFEGEDDGTKHKGLHALSRLIERKDSYELEKTDTDAENGSYAGWVKLSKHKAWKGSTFFPDTWREDDVTSAIEEAFRAYRTNKGEAQSVLSGSGLSWAGYIKEKKIWIGGLGDGDSKKDGISTAFPAINGKFVDPNKQDPPARVKGKKGK